MDGYCLMFEGTMVSLRDARMSDGLAISGDDIRRYKDAPVEFMLIGSKKRWTLASLVHIQPVRFHA